MLSHKKSLDILRKTNALLEGHFILSSGLHSSKYIQCAKLLSYPSKAEKICKSLAFKIQLDIEKDFIGHLMKLAILLLTIYIPYFLASPIGVDTPQNYLIF